MKFIAVDWGSSSFRAYLIDGAGHLADRAESDEGVFTHTNGDFATTLMKACGEWLKRWPHLPVIMAGMIGSRNGWIETPYVTCPVDGEELSRRLCTLDTQTGIKIQVVPGISGHSPSGSPDVMRGEEVQIFGALRLAQTANAMVCLPGTHSKWAQVQNGSIHHFSTFFTGEMFALLQAHSSIGAIMDNDLVDEDSFIQGVEYSRQAGGFLHHIFSARARLLTKSWEGKSLSAYLSGMVIGHEFSGARALYPTPDHTLHPTRDTVLVVGNDRLQQLYQLAARVYGCKVTNIDADQAIVAGLSAIAEDSVLAQKESLC